MTPRDTLDDCFRREAGKLVASLVRAFGLRHLELIEDAVQEAMLAALRSWGQGGIPNRPGAWLQRVASNRLIDDVRRRRPQDASSGETVHAEGPEPVTLRDEIRSEQLRMLFLCCDESLPSKTQLVLALKLICGFTTREIALRLFTTEGNLQKRLDRGRKQLASLARPLDLPEVVVLRERVPLVQHIVYLLFNEVPHSIPRRHPEQLAVPGSPRDW